MHEVLPAKTISESKVVTFDFSDVAVAPLTSPAITKATLVGADPSAAGLTVGTPAISGLSILALVSAGLENCSYLLTCTVIDANLQVHQVGATTTTTLAAI